MSIALVVELGDRGRFPYYAIRLKVLSKILVIQFQLLLRYQMKLDCKI